jgi:tetratricopeptide (TPR) repeat protein
MFTCSNCGHQINAPQARLPPFCPRCGTATGVGSNPFADSMVDDEDGLLPDLPELPPPPPMDSMPASRTQGRGRPSKTLFGMPGLSLDDVDGEADSGFALTNPVPAAKPAPAPAPAKPPTAAAKPAVPPLPGKPPVAPPPVGAKPPPVAAPKPPLPGAVPVVPKPPPLPSGAAKPGVPPLPVAKPVAPPPPPRAPDAPIKSSSRAPSAPTGPGRPAPKLADDSGTFERDDPFFTGNPDELPELGSITDGEIKRIDSGPAGMQEFDFDDDGGGALELGDLDLPGGGAAEVIDLPAAGQKSKGVLEFDGIDMPSRGDHDLPDPVADATDGLDLPVSSKPSRPAELEFDGLGSPGDLDLPMPGDDDGLELDLPMPPAATKPVAAPPSKPIAPPPSKPIAAPPKPPPAPAPVKPVAPPPKPAPVSAKPSLPELGDDLDLPIPAGDLPIPSSELPTPVDDFAGFAEGGVGLELEDLPLPADVLPTSASAPKGGSELPTPADILPTPVESLGLDLGDDPLPARKPATTPAKTSEPVAPKPPTIAGKSPAPKPEQRSPTRAIVYGVLGVVVVGLCVGVYGLGEGWFAGEEEIPAPRAGNDGGGGTNPEPDPSTDSGQITERSEAILAKFDEDTPAGYVQALEGLAQDPIARAEAALLLHLRYGPDPVRLAQAGKLLEGHVDDPAPHVRRVLGLALLQTPERAQEALTWFADDPRSQLYRAWALRHSDPEQARVAAQAAATARPGDNAAALTLAELQVESDPEAGLARLRKIVEQRPQQVSAALSLLRAALDQGLLAEAAKVGSTVPAAAVSTGYKAELLRTRAKVARAQGNVGEALRLLEQAIGTDEQFMAARIDKIDLALSVLDSASARAESELLLRQSPQDRKVLTAAVRVAIQAGRDEDARTHLQALGGPESTDPVVHELYGELAALLLDVEAARAAWAKARELDPLRSDTVVSEVALLIKVEQIDPAIALLDDQKAKLAAREDQSTAVRAARAVVERTRAGLLRARAEAGPALTAVEEAVKLDPRDNSARLLRAELLAAVGNVDASEEALEELHERTGGFPGLTEPLGRMLLRKGKLDELDALIGAQLEASEASIEILMTGAALRLAQNKPDRAKVLAERVLDRDGTQTRAHLVLGRVLLAEGEYAAALDEIEAAQTREGDPEVELWHGQALEYNGRAVEARAHYKRALELEPGNLEAAALLGRLYAYEGAAKQALGLLEPVVLETDAYPYAYLAIGIAHRDLGKRDQAVGEFQRARELDPTLFEAYYEEGRILNDRNKHSEAAAALKAGLDKAKDHAQPRQLEDAWRRLGDSYYELGRRADAKAAFEEYLKVAPPNAAGRAEVQRIMKEL